MAADARLAINASIVGGNPTGLGIYSIKLIRALDEIRNDFFVYASSGGAFGSLRARVGRVPRATRPDYRARGTSPASCGFRARSGCGCRRPASKGF